MKFLLRALHVQILLFIIFSHQARSQEIVRRATVTNGGSAIGLDYTLGEIFSTTLLSGNCMLTLGMQQMDLLLTISVSEIASDAGINCLIYPNPTQNEFTLKIKSKIHGDAFIKMYDNYGKLILIEKAMIDFGTSEIKIVPGEIPSGIYFLTITSGNAYSKLKLQII